MVLVLPSWGLQFVRSEEVAGEKADRHTILSVVCRREKAFLRILGEVRLSQKSGEKSVLGRGKGI